MNPHIPNQFYIMVSQYTKKSILESISSCALNVFRNPSKDFNSFASNMTYTIKTKTKICEGHASVVQTWLIDMMYDISCYKNEGNRQISRNETLYLIDLYNDFCNERDKDRVEIKNDALLNVFGFFGEQKRFQSKNVFFDDFCREKHILENISEKCLQSGTTNLNILKVFNDLTGYSFDNYSALVFLIFGYFCGKESTVNINGINTQFDNPLLSKENLKNIIENYSITVEQIKASLLRRQVFYLKPIIKIDNEYISVNPFLLLCLFTNSNYWVIREYFMRKKTLEFTNEFGKYFEYYVHEILDNCLSKDEYVRIKETNTEKRADWIIDIADHSFLVEQKSSLSLLGIKQNQTDIKAMKNYIISCWGEACEQLKTTEEALKLTKPIKIILLYEDYYQGECLDELFRLNSNILNDGRYWLLSIKEFETLFLLYKDNPTLFKKVINEKEDDEVTHCSDGREISKYYLKNNIIPESYLKRYGITTQYDKIKSICE